jgi:23S rRNA (guanosine2251-2'-O)-methyltransferase
MLKPKQITIILDNIRSAYNVGSAFRTADGAGISKIYICGISPYPPHNKLAKTALGATFFVPWEYCKTTEEAIDLAKKEGYEICAVENGVEKTENYKIANYADKLAFVFGNEVEGLSKKILEKCDKIVEIPMHGKKNSLNVATTIGIILFNLVD